MVRVVHVRGPRKLSTLLVCTLPPHLPRQPLLLVVALLVLLLLVLIVLLQLVLLLPLVVVLLVPPFVVRAYQMSHLSVLW